MRTNSIVQVVGALCVVAFVVLGSVEKASAQIPKMINYQGRLTDDTGQPVTDGEHPVRFRIWDDSTDGLVKWTSQPETVLVINGLFNFQLGSKENIPPSTFNDTSLWLGITVGTGPEVPEIEPRTRLVSTPYAFKAWQADYAEYADSAGALATGSPAAGWVDDGTTVRLVSLTDQVGIGTDTPGEALEVAGNIHIEGNLTWQAKTSYLSVPPTAFSPTFPPITGTYEANRWLETTNPGGMRFNAQVHLPHGSTVTKVSFIWDDETIFSNSFFWLYRSAMTFSVDTLASDSTYGDLGYTVSYDDTIDNGIVDNSTYSYYLHILHYPDIKFYGVIIEYSFTESY